MTDKPDFRTFYDVPAEMPDYPGLVSGVDHITRAAAAHFSVAQEDGEMDDVSGAFFMGMCWALGVIYDPESAHEEDSSIPAGAGLAQARKMLPIYLAMDEVAESGEELTSKAVLDVVVQHTTEHMTEALMKDLEEVLDGQEGT